MIKKLCTSILITGFCCLFLGSCALKAPARTPPEKRPLKIEDQEDQTDVYAIPLDNSEEEDREEMKEMRELQAQHKTAS